MSLGQPLARLDGVAKVSGAARFTADRRLPGQLYGVFVHASIPAGRVLRIDASAALDQEGVVRVLTCADLPRLQAAPSPPLASVFMPLQSDEIRHEGQPVAIVLAETLEQAEDGARRVVVDYERRAFSVPGERLPSAGETPDKSPGYLLDDVVFANGDADAALAAAPIRHDAVYGQPSRHANPIEPSATLAAWNGDALTCFDAVQHGGSAQFVLACAFAIPPEQVRILCTHTGGGFGVKGYVWPHQVLAAAAAKVCARPVKLVLSRAAMYSTVGYQPLMQQRVALASDEDGQLLAIRHDVTNITSGSDDYVEFAAMTTKGLYATPILQCSHAVQRHDVNLPGSIRTPFEGPGSWALESAMDELAYAAGIDPLDLRLRNHADVHPLTGRPWSSKKLREAYEEGAALFGWRERSAGLRDGTWLVGSGMATCSMGTFRFPARARISFKPDGDVTLESSFHDIGTGTTTIFAQVAADVLGVDPTRIDVRMGDTALPPAAPTYASTSTISVGTAVRLAAEDVRQQIARLANLPVAEVVMADGHIGRTGGTTAIPVADVLRSAGVFQVVGEGDFGLPGGAMFEVHGGLTPFAMRSFGAVFVEVGVDPELGLVRLRRAVGSYSAGRILNPRTATGQMIGGIVWEWGKAVMEESRHDPQLGRWLSKDLSGVSLPVNADIPGDIRIHFVDEFDPHAGPLGAKGVGELAATGVAAAVANAVFHATGLRLRDLPITPAAILAATAQPRRA